jgi:hypothetical protein
MEGKFIVLPTLIFKVSHGWEDKRLQIELQEAFPEFNRFLISLGMQFVTIFSKYFNLAAFSKDITMKQYLSLLSIR